MSLQNLKGLPADMRIYKASNNGVVILPFPNLWASALYGCITITMTSGGNIFPCICPFYNSFMRRALTSSTFVQSHSLK